MGTDRGFIISVLSSPDRKPWTLRTDPQLRKFQPLERILLYDHFDCGLSGWIEVLADYEGRLEKVTQYLELMDSRPPMRSTATKRDSGSAGPFLATCLYEGGYPVQGKPRGKDSETLDVSPEIAPAVRTVLHLQAGSQRGQAQ